MRKFDDLGLKTRELELELEGHRFILTLVAEPDILLDRLLAKGEAHEDVVDERIPYWAELWPSALALSRYLLRASVIRPGMEVLEIGCGLGLPGIVAGALGARVTFSDYLPEALAMARHNWERNVQGEAQFVRMDWRAPEPGRQAELVLASDVAYEERAFDPLPAAFRQLCRPGGMILLSEPDRAMARPFLQRLPDHGFRLHRHQLTGELEGLPYRVNVLEISNPA